MIVTKNTTTDMILLHLKEHGLEPMRVYRSPNPRIEDDAIDFGSGISLNVGPAYVAVMKACPDGTFRSLYAGNVMKSAIRAIKQETQA